MQGTYNYMQMNTQMSHGLPTDAHMVLSPCCSVTVQIASKVHNGHTYVRYHLPQSLDVMGFEAANNLCQDLHGANASLATFDSVADWMAVVGNTTSNSLSLSNSTRGLASYEEPVEPRRATRLESTFMGLLYTNYGKRFIWADGKERPEFLQSVDMQMCASYSINVEGGTMYSVLGNPAPVCCASAILMPPGTPPFNINLPDGQPMLSYEGNSSRYVLRFKPCFMAPAIVLCKYRTLGSEGSAQTPMPPTPPAHPAQSSMATYTTRELKVCMYLCSLGLMNTQDE